MIQRYQVLKEWLEVELRRFPSSWVNKNKITELEQILDLCADLVTADIRDWEDIVAQIEEALR